MRRSRVPMYLDANELVCNARRQERQIALDLLDVRPGNVVVDAPAWGGYLAEGVGDDAETIICVEPSREFCAAISRRFMRICRKQHDTGLANESVDRVGSMVGMHHIEPRAFVTEAFRILKPGGRFVASEVCVQTNVAKFLNESVHKLSAFGGHRGHFFDFEDMPKLLETGGFVEVHESLYELSWRFRSYSHMTEFCRDLFGLRDHPGAIGSAIEDHFELKYIDGELHMPWPLLYVVGDKP